MWTASSRRCWTARRWSRCSATRRPAKADFRKVNEALRDSADKANRYANLLMPVNANIGWLSYALVAIVGAVLGINGLAGVTLGTVITFVGLNKSFTQPITQVSQQVNFVVTAAAGAQRVFDLMDQDAGDRRGLCGAGQRPGGCRRPAAARPRAHQCLGLEAPPQGDGTVTYTKLEGERGL